MKETYAESESRRIRAAWQQAGLDDVPDSPCVPMGAGTLGPIEVAHWSGRGAVLRVWCQLGERGTPRHRIHVCDTVAEALRILGVEVAHG